MSREPYRIDATPSKTSPADCLMSPRMSCFMAAPPKRHYDQAKFAGAAATTACRAKPECGHGQVQRLVSRDTLQHRRQATLAGTAVIPAVSPDTRSYTRVVPSAAPPPRHGT